MALLAASRIKTVHICDQIAELRHGLFWDLADDEVTNNSAQDLIQVCLFFFPGPLDMEAD
jgi:hypothetical protein